MSTAKHAANLAPSFLTNAIRRVFTSASSARRRRALRRNACTSSNASPSCAPHIARSRETLCARAATTESSAGGVGKGGSEKDASRGDAEASFRFRDSPFSPFAAARTASASSLSRLFAASNSTARSDSASRSMRGASSWSYASTGTSFRASRKGSGAKTPFELSEPPSPELMCLAANAVTRLTSSSARTSASASSVSAASTSISMSVCAGERGALGRVLFSQLASGTGSSPPSDKEKAPTRSRPSSSRGSFVKGTVAGNAGSEPSRPT
mmetsp:Transcript_3578/g.14448  ORF Transcript_3578/g.14448 Transcript_3578/m.14448 type:complete len:269 (+) Transcript_3578:695-1501(+)